MPLTVVAPAQIGEETTGAAVILCTVTAVEATLSHLPVDVALAVIELPATKAVTVAVHNPPEAVAVPILEPPA